MDPTSESALISPADLAARLSRVRVLDVQYDLACNGPDLYAVSHLPGAPHLDLDSVLADPPGDRGRHPLPSPSRLQAGLRAVGLHNTDSVVVYDQQTSLGAARAWWVLRWAGLTDVRVLDGGLAAWARAELPLSTDPVTVSPGTITVRTGSLPVLEVSDVLAHLERGGVLLDARAAERFRGEVEPIDTEAGHIPGATSLPVTEVLGDDGTFAAPEVIRAVLDRHGIGADRIPERAVLATSCGSGITACQLSLALHEAGIDSVPYIGSWSEWIRDPERPRGSGAGPA